MKKSNNIFIFIILSVCLLIIYFNKRIIIQREQFESNDIDMYVISLRNNERLENIKTQQDKIGKSVQIFDAIKGNTLNSSELFKNDIIDKSFENASGKDLRVIGCYLSHLHVLKKIKNNNKNGYTIIFEDDFDIVSSTFMKDINDILKKTTDFDLIMIGNLNNNKGENVIDNIYNIDNNTPLWGTHGYIVNNKHINKIIETIKFVDMPIDNKYESLGKSDALKIFIINPTIVNQQAEKFGSTINTEGFLSDTFSKKYYVFE